MKRTRMVLRAICLVAVTLAGCQTAGDGDLQECTPVCSGRVCGDDGCGGSCGVCEAPAICTADGLCVADGDAQNQGSDVATFEVLIPDADSAKVCQSIYLQFNELLAEASACEQVLDCRHVIAGGDPCHCALFVADAGAPGKLAAIESVYVAQGCAAREPCEACPWAEVPVCNHGECAPSSPACSELEGQYAQAVSAARQCESDADCTGRVYGSLDCACDVAVNGAAWTGYFDLAAELWASSECGVPRDCSCQELTDVACLDGLCVAGADGG